MDVTPAFKIPLLSTGASMAIVAYLWTKELYRIGSSTSKPLFVNPSSLENEINYLPVATKQKPILRSFVQYLVEHCDQWLQFWRISMQAEKESFSRFLEKLNLMENMRVTLLGTVDGRATAREVLKSETLNEKDAFRLACVNCMFDEVMSIWPRVQSYFVDQVYNLSPAGEAECSEVQVFTRYAHEANNGVKNGNLGALCFGWLDCADAWYEFAIRHAVNSGNEVAADHFLNKIRPDKRKEQVEQVAQSVFGYLNRHNAAFVRILILHLGPQQMWEYAKSHAKQVIVTLTQWPLWLFFYDFTLISSRHLSAYDLLATLNTLVKNLEQPHQLRSGTVSDNLIDNYKLVQVKDLFEAVWKDTSNGKKMEVIGLMMEYDTSCKVRPVESLHNVLQGTRWVFNSVFISSNALFEFLLSGFRQNSSGLRGVLYKYLPSCKGVEDVEFMLMTYESQTFEDYSILTPYQIKLDLKALNSQQLLC